MNNFWELNVNELDRVALVSSEKRITYRELKLLVKQVESELLEATSDVRQVIGLEFDLSLEAIVNYLAILQAGYPVLIAEPGQFSTNSGFSAKWLPKYVCSPCGNGINRLIEFGEGREFGQAHPDLAILLSTSGTTGDPKLVRLSKNNISSNARSISEYLGIQESDVAATTLPLFYSYGLSVLNSYLQSGATVFVTELAVSEGLFWDQSRSIGVTSLAMVPHQFGVLQSAGFDGSELPTLRYITQAGGRLDKSLVEKFHRFGEKNRWDFYIMYGQTEASPRIAYVPPDKLPDASDTIGIAVPGGKLTVLDDVGESDIAGAKGELIYRGPNVMMGYATEENHLSEAATTDKLMTGDIAEVTSDGLFRIIGRAKRFIKILGKRISLDQVESFLAESGVKCVAAGNDSKLVLLVSSGDLSYAKNQVCFKFSLPVRGVIVEPIDSIPLLPSGKIDYRGVGDRANDLIAREASSSESLSLLDFFKRITGNKSLTWDDTFQSAAGDSLAYLEAQLYFQDKIGYTPKQWDESSFSKLQEEFLDNSSSNDKLKKHRSTLPVDAILRSFAISAIVIQHATTFPTYGGTWVLFVLMGLSFGKYQISLISKSDYWSIFSKNLIPIVPLYAVIVILYSAFKSPPNGEFFVLLGNYVIDSGAPLLEPLWFVSAYFQVILVLVAISFIPLVRSINSEKYIALVLVSLSLIVYLAEGLLMSVGSLTFHHERGLANCLLLFSIGVSLVHLSRYSLFVIFLAMGTWATVDIFETKSLQNAILISVVVVVLILFKEVSVSTYVSRIFIRISSLSLFIYLTHQIPANLFGYRIPVLQDHQLVIAVLTILAAIALAQISKSSYGYLTNVLREFRSR